MNVIEAVEAIKQRFAEAGNVGEVPLLQRGSFTARMVPDGVIVDNLDNQPFLHWAAFQEAVCILIRNGGQALRGNAMDSKLGEPGLPLDSVEGHIAQVVYGKRLGESVFRRITPIACILIWADVCEPIPHALRLRNYV